MLKQLKTTFESHPVVKAGLAALMGLSLSLNLSLPQPAQALKMDHKTHDELIGRLESTLETMSKSAKERPAVIHRLAGLYSDRARLKSMEEVERNCNNCLQAKEDRQKAISYFKNSLNSQPKDKQGEVLVQIAHLEGLNDRSRTSLKIYQTLIKEGRKVHSSRVLALAHLNIAEDHFRKANFKSALRSYKQAERYDLPDKALPTYRSAWCYLNLGNEKKAIQILVGLLKNPELVKDGTFHEDVSSDLASLYPRVFLGHKQIQEMLSLSPENKRKDNLKIMAEEAERLGKSGSAILVWEAYAKEPGFTPVEQIDTQIRIAQLQFNRGKTSSAQKDFKQALSLWKQLGCKDEQACTEIQSRYKKFVTSWNQLKKSNPDKNLLQAYKDYIEVFNNDLEMTHWGALVARDLKDYKNGVQLFRKASVLAKSQNNAKLFEGSLLGEIELAEKSKNKSLIESAYTNYISQNPSGNKVWEIRFARAVLWADQKKSQEAFSEFHGIVTSSDSKSNAYKEKSADLALDQLAAQKDHSALQVRSLEYAQHVPKRRSAYTEVARKAVLNQVPVLAKSSPAKALKKLKEFPTAGATKADLIKLYKNEIVLAQDLQDIDQIEKAAKDLYSLKGLSEADNNYARSVLAWTSELKLDFKSAYHYQKALMNKRSRAEDHLKLAVLAEISGLNSYRLYTNYLKKERNRKQRAIIQANLVKKSSRPWKELKKHLKDLKRSPDLLAEAALYAYAKRPNAKETRKLLKTTRIARYPEGQTLARQFELNDLALFDRKISKHRLNSRNDRLLQTSIQKRLKLLDEADRKVKKSIRSKDWSLKVISLAIAARENERLQKDLLSLPAPRGLNAAQKSEYKNLLFQRSETFRQKAANISGDINNLFDQEKILSGMEQVLQSSDPRVRKILENELNIAEGLVRGSAKKRLSQMLNLPNSRPSQKQVASARQDVRQDPFNVQKVSQLQQLEKQRGEETMAGYLEARKHEIQKGTTL
ncbi:MAG: hypothetical protein CL676_11430 [Bdellovibrionaceae bacterium]|nr:hypothetical protein [Pseudobdellovibrionaceae bacterium]